VQTDSLYFNVNVNVHLNESRFWVDCEIVLKYVKNEIHHFHVLVAYRMDEISCLTKPDQWSHIAWVLNPADVMTRGTDPVGLMTRGWFQYPEFLRNYKSEWKDGTCCNDLDDND